MNSGCICCTLREDLLIKIKKLDQENKFDYLVIESTAVSKPMPVAESFQFTDENGQSLSNFARLDTMVTVDDAKIFFLIINSQKVLNPKKCRRQKKMNEPLLICL